MIQIGEAVQQRFDSAARPGALTDQTDSINSQNHVRTGAPCSLHLATLITCENYLRKNRPIGLPDD
jgi:hypothetical protein